MFNNSYKLLFFFTLFLSTMISITSLSWFNSWMGLEINLLSFISLILKKNNFLIESSIKYFLIQALASNILLFSIILFSFFLMKNNNNFIINLLNMLFILTLMMKIGMAPFHIWFIQISEKMNWINNLFLMTWQKLAPLILMSYCFNFLIFLILSSYTIFVGTIGGLNQTSLRKLMAYSSINHLGWIILSMMINMNNFKIYFILYSILSITVMIMFNLSKNFSIKQLYSKNFSISFSLFFYFPILSLAGLPPLTGFFPKWIILEFLIDMNILFLAFFICYFSLFSIFFYLRMMYNFLILNHFEKKMIFFKKNKYLSYLFMIFLSFMLLFSSFSLFLIIFIFSF
nr:NADH dehydrogenase subunit 2 [Stenochironomus sp. 1CZ]